MDTLQSMVVHVPHSSTLLPEEYRPLFVLGEEALRRELLCMTDWYTDELFACGAPRVKFEISRLVCDVERFRDPARESMTACGMGVCYERTSQGAPLKTVSERHRQGILRRWYDPHHAALTAAVCLALKEYGTCLVLDAHSFASRALPYEPQDRARPQICLGTDDFHTPPGLARYAARLFEEKGYTVALNTPFSGCLVPMTAYRRDRRVQGLMIELNRSLYLSEPAGTKTRNFGRLQLQLGEILPKLARFAAAEQMR